MVASDPLLICTLQNNFSRDADSSMYYLILLTVLILSQLPFQNPSGIVCAPSGSCVAQADKPCIKTKASGIVQTQGTESGLWINWSRFPQRSCSTTQIIGWNPVLNFQKSLWVRISLMPGFIPSTTTTKTGTSWLPWGCAYTVHGASFCPASTAPMVGSSTSEFQAVPWQASASPGAETRNRS